jgi:hypothetical protein
MARSARTRRELHAHLFGFIFLKRAGMRLACAEVELCQYVKNLAALDFHLSREIVDSNLTHPPLFKKLPKALSRS